MSNLLNLLKCGRLNVCLISPCRNFNIQSIAKLNVWYPEPQVDQLETAYNRFTQCPSNSLLKKYLTRDLYERLKSRRTSFNSTLLDCVQSGFTNLDSVIGVYAPDAEAYTVFAELFDPIINDIHGFPSECKHPEKYFGNLHFFRNVDPYDLFVLFTKIEARRCLNNFAFTPALQIHQFDKIQNTVARIVCGLEKELEGKYYPLSYAGDEYVRYLKSCGYFFDKKDRFLRAANGLNGWPVGRGVFINDYKNFIIWVNEEDHIRIFSQDKGGNFLSVYQKLIKALNIINIRLKYAHHERLGFLTACPSNLENCLQLTESVGGSYFIPPTNASKKEGEAKTISVVDWSRSIVLTTFI